MLKMKLLLAVALAAVALLAVGCDGRDAGPRSQTKMPDGDTISVYIKKLLENLRTEMPNGVPQLKIPPLEPLKLANIDIPNIKEGIANIELDLKNFEMRGLSFFRVESAQGNTERLGIDIQLYFPALEGGADYDLDGKVLFFPLYGKGRAHIKVSDLRLRVKAEAGVVGMDKMQLKNLKVDLTFSQVQMYLEGIVGGGNLGDVVNMLLNSLGKLVYDKLKHLILPEASRIIVSAVNNELAKVNIKDIIGGIMPFGQPIADSFDNTANVYVDRLMEEVRPHIRNNVDPLVIPDQVASFSKKIVLVTVRGSARLTGGRLNGLSSIHRAGNCAISGANNRFTVSCLIGVNSLNGGFNARAEFMGIGVNARVNINVARVRVHFGVSGAITQGSSPSLDRFSITEVSAVNVRVSGLGPLDWILSSVANVVVNAVKGQIVRAIEGPVRNELRKVLGNVKIPDLAGAV